MNVYIKTRSLLNKDEIALNKAVKFWSDFLRGSKPTHFYNSDTSLSGSLTVLIAGAARAMIGKIPKDKVSKFEEALKDKLTSEDRYFLELEVNKKPDRILKECLTEAGIKSNKFILPWETYMNFKINNGKLEITTFDKSNGNPTLLYSQS